MKFRPCIDIHNGKVKQIVGGSLKDQGNMVCENFVSEQDAAYFAGIYKEYGLKGGHIILLNPASSEYYEQTKAQAVAALRAYPGGLQIGGGITAENAKQFLDAGASHVIVTSYVFQNGQIRFDHLEKLQKEIGKKHLVLDLSCRKRDGNYYIVTDRWQNFTDVVLKEETIEMLSSYCDEYLIHAVDVEGKSAGIEEAVAETLGTYCKIPATYAGGVHSYEDLTKLRKLGQNKIDVTIGSALDLFGGKLEFTKVLSMMDPV